MCYFLPSKVTEIVVGCVYSETFVFLYLFFSSVCANILDSFWSFLADIAGNIIAVPRRLQNPDLQVVSMESTVFHF